MPRFQGGLRRHLVLLVMVALLPMLAWSAALTWWNAQQQRSVLERGMAETAEVMALAIDQHLRMTAEALGSASLSRVLARGEFPSFYVFAQRLAELHPDWRNVVLVAASGEVILNTLVPYPTRLPPISDPAYGESQEAVRQVLETGRPAVSDLFIGPVAGEPLIAVVVPVRDGKGEVVHALAAGLRLDVLANLLTSEDLPNDWFAAVAGRHGRVIARAPFNESLIGASIPAWARNAVASAPRGTAQGRTLNGMQSTVAFHRLGFSDWVAFYGAPTEAFVGPLRRSFLLTASVGLVGMGLSVLLALAVARRILEPVRALTSAAEPFVPPGKPGKGYAIRELDSLHRALDGLSVALSESENRFRQLFATAPVMLDVTDDEGRLVEVNDTWLKTLGYDRADVLGRFPWEFQTQESRMAFPAAISSRLARMGAIEDVPVQFVTRSGEIRDVLVSARAEHGPRGGLRQTIAALRDITEQRRTETALARAIEEAERANDAKTRFLAAASHDLRQPLQALTLYVGVLNSRLGKDGGAVMAAVGQCVDSLTGLLNDMLDVARLDAGTIEPKVTAVPVAQLLERVAASWRIQAEAKGLSLSISSCACAVSTDPALMERVLSNLVSNAVRYTERGRILVGCRRAGEGRLRLEVWDTGPGIPAHAMDDIFEEFRQLGNPERRRDKGTGLGLAIVRRIAELLGHQVSVRSVPGKGSVFAVTLPLADGGPAAQGPADTPLAGHGRRILVIEDEVHVRDALELVLTELGHKVAAGETVEQALDRLAGAPDLVIADYRLPGTSGIEAIRSVRRRFGDVPALVLTGDTDPGIIQVITASGLQVLHKPLQVGALRGFLAKVA